MNLVEAVGTDHQLPDDQGGPAVTNTSTAQAIGQYSLRLTMGPSSPRATPRGSTRLVPPTSPCTSDFTRTFARLVAFASVSPRPLGGTTSSLVGLLSFNASRLRDMQSGPSGAGTDERSTPVTTTDIPAIDIPAMDHAKLEAFVGQAVVDMGAAISGLLLHIGDRLGLYRGMAGAGPITSATLAHRTGTSERYVREWLGNQAAGGYVVYDPAEHTYVLPAEQAMVVANQDSPVFLGGAFETIASCYADHDVFVDAFRTGAGIGWAAHDHRLFSGVVRLFRPSYAAYLVQQWLPSLDGVVEKLRSGASVADVGCGFGASTVIMAQSFGLSTFAGFDLHERSIEAARKAAAQAGVHERARFGVATAKELPLQDYDLVCMFDALHDMGDPVGAARRIR